LQGLAHNGISGRVFCGLLDSLQSNSTLTSLDLSHNDLATSPQVDRSLRQFLRTNKGMRSIGLSYNRLLTDSIKEIALGVLENDGN
jgi:hypothetical protein